jgi:GNAT superfamily N-acetyltransferase
MADVQTLVSYLEMMAAPVGAALPAPLAGLEVHHAIRPTLSFHRYLYDAIGADWTWYERKKLGDAQLTAILHDPRVEVNVLWVRGVPAGLAELDGRDPPDIELAYFGILPEFIGQGLGRWLVDWAIHRAWRSRPRRFWIHTCDLDHPRALPLYQKAGFRLYDQQMTLANP